MFSTLNLPLLRLYAILKNKKAQVLDEGMSLTDRIDLVPLWSLHREFSTSLLQMYASCMDSHTTQMQHTFYTTQDKTVYTTEGRMWTCTLGAKVKAGGLAPEPAPTPPLAPMRKTQVWLETASDPKDIDCVSESGSTESAASTVGTPDTLVKTRKKQPTKGKALTSTVQFDPKLTGRLIGTKGATIKKMQAESGSVMNVKDGTVCILGTAEQIKSAEDAVREILKSSETRREVPSLRVPSLRVTNLSDDTTEQDLQELFRPFGRIAKISVPCVPGGFANKGFGFVDFCDRTDAQRAVDKLHRHGYRHLILHVEWAKPSRDIPEN